MYSKCHAISLWLFLYKSYVVCIAIGFISWRLSIDAIANTIHKMTVKYNRGNPLCKNISLQQSLSPSICPSNKSVIIFRLCKSVYISVKIVLFPSLTEVLYYIGILPAISLVYEEHGGVNGNNSLQRVGGGLHMLHMYNRKMYVPIML